MTVTVYYTTVRSIIKEYYRKTWEEEHARSGHNRRIQPLSQRPRVPAGPRARGGARRCGHSRHVRRVHAARRGGAYRQVDARAHGAHERRGYCAGAALPVRAARGEGLCRGRREAAERAGRGPGALVRLRGGPCGADRPGGPLPWRGAARLPRRAARRAGQGPKLSAGAGAGGGGRAGPGRPGAGPAQLRAGAGIRPGQRAARASA